MDPDDIETYFAAVDEYTLAVSEIDQLSYAARTDYASTETFANPNSKSAPAPAPAPAPSSTAAVASQDNGPRGEIKKGPSKLSFLDQCRVPVERLKGALETIVALLHLV